MKIRNAVVAGLAAVAAMVGVGVTAASATTVATATCPAPVSFTTHVVNRPDSSAHGDWAKDTFTRTTTVTCVVPGTYKVTLADSGSFTPLPGALSPTAGLPIQNLPFTGTFVGGTSFVVESAGSPVNPTAGASGKYSSSEWAKLVFPNGKAEQGAFGWTYSHCGETWVNASAGNHGDITGKKCHVPPTKATPTSPAPTTTVTAPPTATSGNVPPVTVPVKVVVNPGQFAVTPNTSKGVDTGDGSLS